VLDASKPPLPFCVEVVKVNTRYSTGGTQRSLAAIVLHLEKQDSRNPKISVKRIRVFRFLVHGGALAMSGKQEMFLR
jgi:hypothetical protein